MWERSEIEDFDLYASLALNVLKRSKSVACVNQQSFLAQITLWTSQNKAKKINFEILIFHVSQKNKGSSNAPDPRALGSDQDPEHKFLCQNLEK